MGIFNSLPTFVIDSKFTCQEQSGAYKKPARYCRHKSPNISEQRKRNSWIPQFDKVGRA